MSSMRKDGKARFLLTLMVLLGWGLLVIPFFLTPPAFLDLALRDTVFSSDLSGQSVQITDGASGHTLTAAAQKEGGDFLARVGRIDSGEARSFIVAVEGYRSVPLTLNASALQHVRAVVDLVPTFGRLEVSTVSATHADNPIPALLKRNGVTVSSRPLSTFVLALPAGSHRFSAEATGFCAEERDVNIEAGKLARLKLPLSPDLTGDEIARFVLGWGPNPRDLDAHFRKLGTSGYPNPEHVFFHRMEGDSGGGIFARLDVDYRNSEGYETITVYNKAAGMYEYYVARYAGEGTLGSSGAQVTAFTHGCQRKQLSVPVDCTDDVWNVFHVQVDNGRVALIEIQQCEKGMPLHAGGKTPIAD